jgi:uncharacterized protein YbjT (DUF2867 family)
MGLMRVVVTGGQGDLGARVVRRLREAGHDVVPASRRTGVDLSTGAGLRDAVLGAQAVVHCATNPTRAAAVDVAGTRLLADAVAQEGHRSGVAPHLVSVSIVGCDRTPLPYYRAKHDSELAIERAGVPATVARATQFHALAAFVAKSLRLGPIGLTIGDLAIQPVDVEWVAARLADHTHGPAPQGFRRAVDLAGPEVHTLPELARRVAEHDGRAPSRRTLRIPPLGATMRAFAQRAIVPVGEVETGGRRFEDWLAAQPSPLPRGMRDSS